MTRQRARSTGWLTLAITVLTVTSLLVFTAVALAQDSIDLDESGTDQSGLCEGDYFKVESADELMEGTHTYTGATYDGVAISFVLTVALDGEGEVDSITFVSATLPISSIVIKGGGGNEGFIEYFPPFTNPLTAAQGAISNVALCVGEEGSLTIVKDAAGTTEELFGFTGTIDGAITSFDLGDGDSKVFEELGAYVITEEAVEGWYLADIDCGEAAVELVDSTVSVTIEDGDHVTCTFVNEMVPVEREAVLTIVKDADGNTTEEFSFLDGDVSLTGGESFWIEFTDEDFGEEEEVLVDIWETLTEAQEEALWELVDIDCDTESFDVAEDGTLTVSLVDGDDVTCTFFNEQGTPVVGALLSLEKAVPGAAANGTEFGFTLGGAALGSTVSEADAPLVLANVAGTYVIGENAFAGWNLTGIDCTGNATAETVNLTARTVSVPVANGENVVCTFTNTQPTGQVLPGNPTPTPAPRGAVLPSTAMPTPGVDATLVGMLLVLGGGAIGVASSIIDRRR